MAMHGHWLSDIYAKFFCLILLLVEEALND